MLVRFKNETKPMNPCLLRCLEYTLIYFNTHGVVTEFLPIRDPWGEAVVVFVNVA